MNSELKSIASVFNAPHIVGLMHFEELYQVANWTYRVSLLLSVLLFEHNLYLEILS